MATLRNLMLRLGVDVDPLERGFNKAAASAEKFDKIFSRVTSTSATVAGIGSLAGAGTALTAAIAPAAGALVALPAAMAITKTASAVAKVALIGMGEAMSAVAGKDAAALAEALKNLSPEARKFVMESKGFMGAVDPIRKAVQDRVFDGLHKQIDPISKNLLPTVKSGMLGVASSFNAGAKEAGKFAASPVAKGTLNAVFKTTKTVMDQAATAVGPLLGGVASLTKLGLPLAQRMAEWAINGIKVAGAFLSSEAGAKKLSDWATRAGDTLAQLGRIAANLGRFLGGVFESAKFSGDGVLSTIEQVTAKMAQFSQSAGGQERLTEGFTLLLEILRSVVDVLPLFMGPLAAVATILTSMSPEVRGVVTQFLAFAVVGGLLAGKLAGTVGVLKNVTMAAVGAGGAAIKFGQGMMQGTAGLAAGSGAAAKAGAAVRGFGSTMVTGIAATGRMVTSLSATAGAYMLTGMQAAGAAIKTAAFTAASLASTAASKVMAAGIWLVNAAMKANPIGLVIGVLTALGAALVLAYNKSTTFRNIVQAAWKGIQTAVSYAWNSIIKPAFTAVVGFITGTLAPKISWLYNNIVKPIFTSVGRAVSAAWNSVIKPAFTALVGFVTGTLGPKVNWLYNSVISPIFTRIGNVIRTVYNSTIKPVFETFRKVVTETIPNAFKSAVSSIGTFWGKVQEIARKPVAFVVNTVYMKGIYPVWNWVAGKVGLPQLPKLSFATGGVDPYGVRPGYTPGRDTHLIGVGGGESIMRPEFTRAVGPGFINAANYAARTGGVQGVIKTLGLDQYNQGGIVGWVSSFMTKAKNFFQSGFYKAAQAVLNPLVNLTQNAVGSTSMGGLVTGLVDKAVSGILAKFKPLESELAGGDAKGVIAAAAKYIGKGDTTGDNSGNYFNQTWGWPNGTPWCANFVSTALRDAKAGKHYPGYPTAAVYGYWSRMNKVASGSARPGDLGVWRGPTGHINLIEKPLGGGTMQTIGGNEGPVVRRGTRSGPYAVLRPSYATGGIFDRRMYQQNNLDPRDRTNPFRKALALEYDNGGLLQPGYTLAYNGTGKPEYTFTRDQLDRGLGGGNTYHITAQVPLGSSKGEVGREIVECIKTYESKSGTRWRGTK